jgi:hypothetical protein
MAEPLPDLADLEVEAPPNPFPGGTRWPPRLAPGERFLMGPLPWACLEQAARLPHKALQVLLRLCLEAGYRRQRTVSLCLDRFAEMGVKEDTARRGLRELERAGLVRIQRPPGRALQVTLLTGAAERGDSYPVAGE